MKKSVIGAQREPIRQRAARAGVLCIASLISLALGASSAAALALPQEMQDLLKYIFVDVGRLGLSGDTMAIVTVKVMLFIMAFALLYTGLAKGKVFGEHSIFRFSL